MIICICGINGKMGTFIYNELKDDYKVVGIDKEDSSNVYSDYKKCFEENKVDVLVDFSSKEISVDVIKYALENKIKVISGTTSLSTKDIKYLKKLAIKNKTSFILSSNFAKGIKMFYNNIARLKKGFSETFLIETHHSKKLDKPSGTAKVIAKKIKIKDEDITALRLPRHNATHEVIFSNDLEKLTIKHEILDYKAFVNGFLEELDDLLKDITIIRIY